VLREVELSLRLYLKWRNSKKEILRDYLNFVMNSVGFSLTRPRRENKETCELFFYMKIVKL
jgi:hypothetical protein